jgi:hypothetical protein
MDGLIEGRIVHFVMPDGKHTPAIIAKVWNDNGLVNLQVITDGSNALPYTPEEKTQFSNFGMDLEAVKHGHVWMTSRSYSDKYEPGTWHWVEKTPPAQ